MTAPGRASAPTIGVIGASGQVGAELCLYLHLMEGVRVVALCRNELAAEFLRRCGVECRTGVLETSRDAGRLLEGCDVVCDLSRPRGLASQMRAVSTRIIESLMSGAPRGAPYVFASSYMALGMSRPGERFRRRRFAGTAYGAYKRWAERVVLARGRAERRDTYVLRLGEVHGDMQRVSRLLLADLDGRAVRLPAGPSNTIFVFSIAEALRGIGSGRESPGLYMATSVPQWSWRELFEFWLERRGIACTIHEDAPGTEWTAPRASWLGSVRARGLGILLRNRETLMGYFLARMPALELRAKARYMERNARSRIAEGLRDRELRPCASAYVGDAPGRRLSTLTDSRATMRPIADLVRARLDTLVPEQPGS